VKKLFKWLFKLLLLLAVLVGLLLLFRNPIVKALLEREIRKETGLEVFIGHLRVGVTSPVLEIENLRLFNPPEFDRGTFADLPELSLEYDREALLRRQLRLRTLRLNVFEIHFVRNQDGTTNLRMMRDRSAQRRRASSSRADVEFTGIDVLSLTLGRFKYTDRKEPSRSDELWLGVRNTRIKDVRSFEDLEPFLVKLTLEKNLKPVFDQLFRPPQKPGSPPVSPPGRLPAPVEAEGPAK